LNLVAHLDRSDVVSILIVSLSSDTLKMVPTVTETCRCKECANKHLYKCAVRWYLNLNLNLNRFIQFTSCLTEFRIEPLNKYKVFLLLHTCRCVSAAWAKVINGADLSPFTHCTCTVSYVLYSTGTGNRNMKVCKMAWTWKFWVTTSLRLKKNKGTRVGRDRREERDTKKKRRMERLQFGNIEFFWILSIVRYSVLSRCLYVFVVIIISNDNVKINFQRTRIELSVATVFRFFKHLGATSEF
jgi:hypothetical protein